MQCHGGTCQQRFYQTSPKLAFTIDWTIPGIENHASNSAGSNVSVVSWRQYALVCIEGSWTSWRFAQGKPIPLSFECPNEKSTLDLGGIYHQLFASVARLHAAAQCLLQDRQHFPFYPVFRKQLVSLLHVFWQEDQNCFCQLCGVFFCWKPKLVGVRLSAWSWIHAFWHNVRCKPASRPTEKLVESEGPTFWVMLCVRLFWVLSSPKHAAPGWLFQSIAKLIPCSWIIDCNFGMLHAQSLASEALTTHLLVCCAVFVFGHYGQFQSSLSGKSFNQEASQPKSLLSSILSQILWSTNTNWWCLWWDSILLLKLRCASFRHFQQTG